MIQVVRAFFWTGDVGEMVRFEVGVLAAYCRGWSIRTVHDFKVASQALVRSLDALRVFCCVLRVSSKCSAYFICPKRSQTGCSSWNTLFLIMTEPAP